MKRVLIADDSLIQRKLIERRLTQMGFSVVCTADGQEALECIRREPPDAVIADITMPGLNGFQLCRAIRSDSALAHIPVILASAENIEDANRRQASEAGASGFAVRTADLQEVLSLLQQAL